MKRIIILLCLLFAPAYTIAQQPSAREIAQKIDELYRAESSYAEMEMHIVTEHWERTLRMKTWTEGTEKTFIRITAPAKEDGVGTLRIENEMWNYLPNTNKVMRIPPSMMMSSWMGSDFNNNDLVQEFSLLKDYNFELIHPDTANSEYYYLQATPVEGRPIVWGKRISTVRKNDFIPVKEEYYDDDGEKMRVLTFSEIQNFDDREIPAVMKMNPLSEDGYTTVRYLDAEFNTDIPEDIFTLRNLRTPE
ncbi:MAG: outer membrane lipoprotein-sorting protein [Candidatus Marinimicrobia bacterium]|nr:outer membrane lipoprotein-sorting protein [Candidatus Neomarinimicrobiota bacterium]